MAGGVAPGMNSTSKSVVSNEAAESDESEGRRPKVSKVKLLGVPSLKETDALPVLLRLPPVIAAVMSSPFVALRVNVMTKVYCVPLAYPVTFFPAPFASLVQVLLSERNAPEALLSINWNELLLPSIVA